MEKLWCWRCKMVLGMLDEDESRVADELHRKGMLAIEGDREERYQPLFDYYFFITGEKETNPNAIMHHRIALYGPPCEKCGKPYRTPKASFCAACGNRRAASRER